MDNSKSYKHISQGLLITTLLLLTYSFGTFGFLNLFGLRIPVQALSMVLVVGVLVNIKIKSQFSDFIVLFTFLILFGFGGVVYGGYLTRPIESIVILFCIIAIVNSPSSYIITFSKYLTFSCTLFCGLVLIAYVYYAVNPDQYSSANHNIYHSDVGFDRVFPAIPIDWLSFTSGDGFEFNGNTNIRLKGYSNEPSSTIVHYLAPAVLAFLYGGAFTYIGVFILLVNVVTIGSLIAYLIVAQSVLFYVFLFYFKRLSRYFIYSLILILCLTLVQPTLVKDLFFRVGSMAIDSIGLDLIARKVGDGSDNSSLGERLIGISNGFYLALLSPIGYSFDSLGSGAGFLYIISASTGWFGLFVYFRFMRTLFRKSLMYTTYPITLSARFSVALALSLVIVVSLISGYGWDRPAGIIMLLTIYRVISIKLNERYYISNNHTRDV